MRYRVGRGEDDGRRSRVQICTSILLLRSLLEQKTAPPPREGRDCRQDIQYNTAGTQIRYHFLGSMYSICIQFTVACGLLESDR